MGTRALFCAAALVLAVPASARDKPADGPDAAPNWSAMRVAGEKAVRDLLVLPKSGRFDWQAGFVKGSWRPYNSKSISGWLTCGVVYAKDRFGFERSQVFVVVLRSGRVAYADMDAEAGGTIERGCGKLKLHPPQAGMLDSPSR